MGIGYEERRKVGKRGEAEVRVLRDSVKVVFADDGFAPEFSKEDVMCPVIAGRGLFVQLSPDEQKIQAIRPYKGTFYFRLVDFAHKEGEAPTFRQEKSRQVTFTNDEGKQQTFTVDARLAWTALLEIVDDKEFEGVIFPFTVPYVIDRDNITGNAIIAGDPSNAKKMRNFMEMFGIDFEDDAIPYASNILPMLLEILLDRGEFVSAQVERGWIKNDSFAYPPTGYKATLKKKTTRKATTKAKPKATKKTAKKSSK